MDVVLIVLSVFLPGWSSGAYIIFVANFITIIGVVIATVWAIGQSRLIRPRTVCHLHVFKQNIFLINS
jgi:hypothetical protein